MTDDEREAQIRHHYRDPGWTEASQIHDVMLPAGDTVLLLRLLDEARAEIARLSDMVERMSAIFAQKDLEIARLRAPPEADVMTPEEFWRDLCEKDDRTSPEDYPDMALVTEDELTHMLTTYGDQREKAAVAQFERWAKEHGDQRAREAEERHKREDEIRFRAHDNLVASLEAEILSEKREARAAALEEAALIAEEWRDDGHRLLETRRAAGAIAIDIRALAAAPPQSGWRDIASAPRVEGPRYNLLLWWPHWRTDRPVIGHWTSFDGGWRADEALSADCIPPTHWMPLPAPPQSEGGEG